VKSSPLADIEVRSTVPCFQELFHGPTFAFKDVALQMLGHFFAYFLRTGSNGGRLTILGATSGDTGSAAIAGLRGKPGIQCVILFPNGRVSAIQERQMTSILDENIHCVAVDGTFDDCQDIVKASFDTPDFRDAVHLGAVNSINWCRVLAQTTYYVWTYLRLTTSTATTTTTITTTTTSGSSSTNGGEIHFSVPTGNFGDVLAGYYAKRMGLSRIGKLIVATNENDILHRFFTKGEYHRESIQETISPSMDICVSSNFERYLFHLAKNDAHTLNGWMTTFEATGKLTIDGTLLRQAQSDFDSARADTKATLATIRDYYQTDQYLLCPHSAVGVAAVHQLGLGQSIHTVCLATAHAGKFPDAVQSVVPDAPTPPALAALASLPTRRTELPNNVQAVQAFVRQVVAQEEATLKQKRVGTMIVGGLVTAIVAGVVAMGFQLLKNRTRR
jgi:threonine synthase